MGRCTAVEILELDEDMPSHVDPETMLHADQRLPLLEEIWEALTDAERRTISDRLAEKQHGVQAAEGCKGGTGSKIVLKIACSNRPRPSVHRPGKGHQHWRRDVHHLAFGDETLCGHDAREWITMDRAYDATAADPDLCKRCSIIASTKN